LAEITLDNPNVWFELGFAFGCKKEVVLICSDARPTRFPFDVQHRAIIKYKTGSPSDFEALKRGITDKINAYVEKSESLANITSLSQLTTPTEGFTDHEVVALAAITQNIAPDDDYASTWQVQRDMEANGYTKIASSFALKLLTKKGLIVLGRHYGDREDFDGYTLSDKGWDWMLANQNRFSLLKDRPHSSAAGRTIQMKTKPNASFDDMDDNIPF
jgi:hypothetical protein